MIAAYCSCGASYSSPNEPPEAEVLAELFSTLHRGEGHEPIDEETYAANRERRRAVG